MMYVVPKNGVWSSVARGALMDVNQQRGNIGFLHGHAERETSLTCEEKGRIMENQQSEVTFRFDPAQAFLFGATGAGFR